MSRNDQQSSTRNTTRESAQQSVRDERERTASSQQISAERKTYLATTYALTPEQVDVVRNVICPQATDTELEFFLATCRRVKLDAFSRQIYFIKRRQRVEDQWGNENWIDVGRPEVSIDGLRAGAEQTGDYEGQGAVQWCGVDGKWTDVWLKDTAPHAAKATVYRKGHREPLVNVALFEEYVPRYKNGGLPAMWKKMPANQLAKCAEAGGLRRAFPRDLSGLYTDTEMEHVSVGASYAAPTKAPANVIDVPSDEQKQLEESQTKKIDELIADITAAKDRNALAPIGALLTAAKKKGEDKRDAFERAVIERLAPELQKKWNELQPTKGGAA